jgi:hypothetical protein
VTVRHVGAFLADPLDVPQAVLDYVAVQVGAHRTADFCDRGGCGVIRVRL